MVTPSPGRGGGQGPEARAVEARVFREDRNVDQIVERTQSIVDRLTTDPTLIAEFEKLNDLANLDASQIPTRLTELRALLYQLQRGDFSNSKLSRLKGEIDMAAEAAFSELETQILSNPTLSAPPTVADQDRYQNKIRDIRNRKTELDDLWRQITDARTRVETGIKELERRQREAQDTRDKIGKELDKLLKDQLTAINERRPDTWTRTLQRYNRAVLPRIMGGVATNLIAAAPGGGAVALLLKGALGLAGSVAGMDATAEQLTERRSLGLEPLRQARENVYRTTPNGFIPASEIKRQILDYLTSAPEAERRERLDAVLRSYAGLLQTASDKGLHIEAATAEIEYNNRASALAARASNPLWSTLDSFRGAVNSSIGSRLLTGLGFGSATLLAASTGGLGGLALATGLAAVQSMAFSRPRAQHEKYYEHSGSIVGIKEALKELGADPNFTKYLEKQSAVIEQVSDYQKGIQKGRQNYRISGLVGGAILQGLIRTVGHASVADTVKVNRPTSPTLHLNDLPDGKVLHYETTTEALAAGHDTPAENLANEVLQGYLKEHPGLTINDQEKHHIVQRLAENWKERDLFSADGSLNPDKRDILEFANQGGIDGLKEAEEVVKAIDRPEPDLGPVTPAADDATTAPTPPSPDTGQVAGNQPPTGEVNLNPGETISYTHAQIKELIGEEFKLVATEERTAFTGSDIDHFIQSQTAMDARLQRFIENTQVTSLPELESELEELADEIRTFQNPSWKRFWDGVPRLDRGGFTDLLKARPDLTTSLINRIAVAMAALDQLRDSK